MSAVLEAREPSARYLEAAQPALVRQFELLATAPGGVARLREFILSLAVQGKLTAQDCSEEPASALLERIQDRKLRSIASGAIKQGKKPAELNDAEPMFELPKGWTWTRLGELCSYIQRGKGPAYAEQSEHKVISQKCVRWYGLDLAPARFVTAESLAKYEPVRFLRAGDLLWNSTGTGTIGRACVVPNELDDAGLVADSHVTVVRPLEVNSVFLWRWIQSPFVQNEIEGLASGTTNQIELNTSTVLNQPVPLPPLAEQARIVDRVDELMRLCDSLEAKGLLEAEQHARLLGTLLGTLTDSSTPEELATNWQRVADRFDLLLDRPEAVDELEATALKLAIAGRLAPQVAHAGSQMNVPAGWVVGTIGELAKVVTDGTHKTPRYVDHGVKFVSAKDVRSGSLKFDECKYITREEHEQLTRRCRPERGDILVSKSGSIGTVVLVEVDDEFSLFESLALIKFDQLRLTSEFFKLAVQNACGSLAEGDIKGVAVKHLHLNVLRSLRILVPPVEEQLRIVARVTELRRLCVNLRQRLAASQKIQTQLSEALVAEVA